MQDFIFTEPDFLSDPLFSGFLKMKKKFRLIKLKILSYFALYKMIVTAPESHERKSVYEILEYVFFEIFD